MATGGESEAYLAKAQESLASAQNDFAARRYNGFANRASYACFQAAVAALLQAGIGPRSCDRRWRHDAVQAQFAELVRRRKLYPAALPDVLLRGATLRVAADYGPGQIRKQQPARVQQRSRTFVAAVRSLEESTR